ncbi:hypothetical protein A9R05_04640 [Burkholderia sp. KK1]|nr:hypothetical protein A9R05_04640 [Burkholderia sp. KK1]
MKIESQTGIEFTDRKPNGNGGYARNWFFWVHSTFKGALDIHFYERQNEEKTAAMRDRRARRLGHESLAAFQERLKSENILRRDSP